MTSSGFTPAGQSTLGGYQIELVRVSPTRHNLSIHYFFRMTVRDLFFFSSFVNASPLFRCATMGSKKIANKRAPKTVKRPISPPSHETSTLLSNTEDAPTQRHAQAAKRVHFQDDDAEAKAPADSLPRSRSAQVQARHNDPADHHPSNDTICTAQVPERHRRTAQVPERQRRTAAVKTANTSAHRADDLHVQDHEINIVETAPALSRAAAVRAKAIHAQIAADEIARDSQGVTVDASDYDTSDLYASDDTPSIQLTKTMKAKTVMTKASTRKSRLIIYPI
jgi:hypothetical protein